MNIVNGHTRICGVIGNPVAHTMSPTIHNCLAAKTGQNLVYVPFHVEHGCLGDAVKGAYALNMLGINVTVPYKSDVIAYVKELDELAQRIGAVNTLVRTEDGYKGYNTDMPGLYRAMCDDKVQITGQKILLLGAGGVAAMLVARSDMPAEVKPVAAKAGSVDILVAKSDIGMGTPLSANELQWQAWPASTASGNFIRKSVRFPPEKID